MKRSTVTITIPRAAAARVAALVDDELRELSECATGNWERDPSPERIADLNRQAAVLEPVANALREPRTRVAGRISHGHRVQRQWRRSWMPELRLP